MGSPNVLTVCTANICRSPAAATLLRRGLDDLLPQATVASAGVSAEDGREACDLTSALVGEFVAGQGSGQVPAVGVVEESAGHASRRLTREHVEQADLILAMDRSHRSAIAVLLPSSRPRTFTLRQAADAAGTVTAALRAGRLPEGAAPVPGTAADRFAWWVGEIDAARAFIAGGDAAATAGLVIDPLDVPDPHVAGYQYHPMAVELIESAVETLLTSLRTVMEFGEGAN